MSTITNEKLNAVKKNCKTIEKIITILQIFILIGVVSCILGIGITSSMKDTVNEQMKTAYENGANFDSNNFNVGIFAGVIDTEELIKENKGNVAVNILCLFGTIMCAFVYIVLLFIKKIFKEIEKSESPFSNYVLKKLKTLFIILTIASFLTLGLGFTILVGFLLRCLYCIFDYGCAIQTEVDETL